MAIPSELKRDMPDGMEIRSFTFALRAADPNADDKKCRLSGQAAVFGVRTQLDPWMSEEIDAAAFDETIKGDDAYMCFNHNPDIVLAGTKNGSLRLSTDGTGLNFEADVADTSAARDAYELVRSGVIDKMSFGFIIQKSEWDESNPQVSHRVIKQVRLLEVSPVLFPAYTSTSVAARAQTELQEYRSRRHNLPTDPPAPEPPEPRKDRSETDRIRKKLLLHKIDKEV